MAAVGTDFRVHDDAWPTVDKFLNRWKYRRVELDGSRMTSRDAAHSELHNAFRFPDWCGKNWDAFNDCFGDFVEENDGALIAVVWRHVDAAARSAPITIAEVGSALLECSTGYMPSLALGTQWSVSLDIFAIGQGDDFDRPD